MEGKQRIAGVTSRPKSGLGSIMRQYSPHPLPPPWPLLDYCWHKVGSNIPCSEGPIDRPDTMNQKNCMVMHDESIMYTWNQAIYQSLGQDSKPSGNLVSPSSFILYNRKSKGQLDKKNEPLKIHKASQHNQATVSFTPPPVLSLTSLLMRPTCSFTP